MIYVLIAVALFAALSFVLSRQTDSSESGTLAEEKIELQSTQIIQTASHIQQAVNRMAYTGSEIDDLVFTIPDDGLAYATPPHIHKVFHPEGGALTLPQLPTEAVNQVNTDPAPGWYMGSFNNVEWTQTTGTDVILVAHQIDQTICARINEKLTGSAVIPTLTVDINKILIDATLHTNAPNNDLDIAECAACDGRPTLCVSNAAGTMWSYYSVIEQR